MPYSRNSLAGAMIGSEFIISELSCTGPIKVRLLELGFIPGTSIICLSKNPLLDSITVRIRGAKISLRNEEALSIKIK